MKPTWHAVLLLSGAFPLALVVALAVPHLWQLWVAWLGAVTLLIGADAVLCLPRGRLAIQTAAPSALYIGDHDPLAVTVRARGWRQRARFEVVLDTGELLVPPPVQHMTMTAGRATTQLPLEPRRRGLARIDALWLRWRGPLGLTVRTVRRPLNQSIRVLANIRAVKAAALRFVLDRTFMAGLKTTAALDAGSEFDSLREYTVGLDHRTIDWNASARHRKLLCREFRAERNHPVVLAFDTGHLMSEPVRGIPKIDHAINAGLLLGYMSLRTGDRVGLFGFDEKVRAYLEPQAGVHSLVRLQHAASELSYSHSETNFTLGLAELSSRLSRRSLIVVLTDFADSVTAELMVDNLDRLARRHLVMFVSLRDPELEVEMAARARSLVDVGRAVAAGDLLRERDVVLRRLARRGILCVDAPPAAVSAALLDRYLAVRRRELV